MNEAILAIFVLGGMGIVLGIILAYFAKKFEVKSSEKVVELEQIMAGLNCGACGYPTCELYSKALLEEGETHFNLCVPGKEKVEKAVTEYMKENGTTD